MSGLRSLLFGSLTAATVAAAPAMAHLMTVPPVPGSLSTAAYGINDNGVVTGTFTGADGHLHAFFGTLDGQYTTFDAGSGGTVARAIDNHGTIVGFSNAESGDAGAQPIFERMANGEIVGVTRSGEQLNGYAFGIESGRHRFVGAYWDPAPSIRRSGSVAAMAFGRAT